MRENCLLGVARDDDFGAGRLECPLQLKRDNRFSRHHDDGLAFETAPFHSYGSLSRADILAHGRGFIMTLDVMREAASAVSANPENL